MYGHFGNSSRFEDTEEILLPRILPRDHTRFADILFVSSNQTRINRVPHISWSLYKWREMEMRIYKTVRRLLRSALFVMQIETSASSRLSWSRCSFHVPQRRSRVSWPMRRENRTTSITDFWLSRVSWYYFLASTSFQPEHHMYFTYLRVHIYITYIYYIYVLYPVQLASTVVLHR